MRKKIKLVFKSLKVITVCIILYTACVFLLPIVTIEKEKDTKEEVELFIITNGVHTDIVMPATNIQKDWTKEILYSNTVANDTSLKYLAVGWGDKGFYLETPTWGDLKTSVAFKAATGLSSTAIHATYYARLNESEYCKKMIISSTQYQRLIDYVSSSFQKNEQGNFINIKTKANYSKNDAFYEAKGRYSIFHTCNTWANNGLKSCGQRCCLWTALDKGIFLKY